MRLRASLHALLSAAVLLSGSAGFVAACTGSDPTSTPSPDAGGDGRSEDEDASGDKDEDDGSSSGEDGGMDAKKPKKDANGPGEAGDPCIFNRDCQSAFRCECDGSPDCVCALGVRGTGENGVTVCTSGDNCSSSVCAEGTDGKSYCTDECETDDDCEAKLPLCKDISFVGRICTRTPPR